MEKDFCVISWNLSSLCDKGRGDCLGFCVFWWGNSVWDSEAWFEPCKPLELCFSPKPITSAREKPPTSVATQRLQCYQWSRSIGCSLRILCHLWTVQVLQGRKSCVEDKPAKKCRRAFLPRPLGGGGNGDNADVIMDQNCFWCSVVQGKAPLWWRCFTAKSPTCSSSLVQ